MPGNSKRKGAIKKTGKGNPTAGSGGRVKRGLEKFTLMGHSLGGYLAVCYALKYPGRLDKLILASPVGITEARSIQTSGMRVRIAPPVKARWRKKLVSRFFMHSSPSKAGPARW